MFASAAGAVLGTMAPWTRVRFEQLFGEHFGEPGWRSTAGFTCLCSCALIGILTLAETEAETEAAAVQQAVRPACLLLVVMTALAMAFECWQGPGDLRGATAAWTYAFYATIACVPFLLFACAARERNRQR